MKKQRRLVWIGWVVAIIVVLNAILLIGPSIPRWLESRRVHQPGFSCRVHYGADGQEFRYTVFRPHVPLEDSEAGYPVLLFLNGFGENGSDGIRQIVNTFGRPVWELKGRFPFMVVAPQCRRGRSWSTDASEQWMAIDILDSVLAEYPADPDRVHLMGVSTGGSGVLDLAAAFPDRFASIVPMAAGSSKLGAQQSAQLLTREQLPVWIPYNGADAEEVVRFNRALRRELVLAGSSPRTIEYDREGHNAWDAGFREPALYRWLLRQSRVGSAQRGGTRFTPARDRSGSLNEPWVSSGAPGWRPQEDQVLLAPSEGQGRLGLATPHSSIDLDFDFHFGSRLVLILDVSVNTANPQKELEYRIVVPSPSRGSGGIQEVSSDQWLADLDLWAQSVLREDQWNQLRLSFHDARLQIELNGWPLIDYSSHSFAQAKLNVGIDVSRNRGLRLREIRSRVR